MLRTRKLLPISEGKNDGAITSAQLLYHELAAGLHLYFLGTGSQLGGSRDLQAYLHHCKSRYLYINIPAILLSSRGYLALSLHLCQGPTLKPSSDGLSVQALATI